MSSEEEVLMSLARALRRTSMLIPNNMNEILMSSSMLKKYFIHTMESCPLGEHKQGFGNNAYTKGKAWREQKTNESSF